MGVSDGAVGKGVMMRGKGILLFLDRGRTRKSKMQRANQHERTGIWGLQAPGDKEVRKKKLRETFRCHTREGKRELIRWRRRRGGHNQRKRAARKMPPTKITEQESCLKSTPKEKGLSPNTQHVFVNVTLTHQKLTL